MKYMAPIFMVPWARAGPWAGFLLKTPRIQEIRIDKRMCILFIFLSSLVSIILWFIFKCSF